MELQDRPRPGSEVLRLIAPTLGGAMPSERIDPSRYGVTEDSDPAMLAGAPDDERRGLDEEPDAVSNNGTDIAECGAAMAPPRQKVATVNRLMAVLDTAEAATTATRELASAGFEPEAITV